ncbi:MULTISPECIES: fimbrial protein [unclassified Variovorax]|jgi:major type 1 subunit fimbrin (pilin)|uniref:fimbrial protein n=1 Tax=unclassified Variovorax TaxID=663243 RepID=UPI000F7DFEF3|nr:MULTISPECIES: fimbrial protein [unclassified Variovorax]RSZ31173.1 fimbrial protein [Variovorax sp. 553]RSZ31589.1 fimbrial protein [Variovorax sp. 679]
MKKFVIAKFAALAAVGLLSQGAFAADGTINFTGEIVDAPCSISPNSQNMTVPLGKVSRTAFDGATAGTAVVGKKATPAKFTIDLLGCGATAKGATVTFTGTADTDATLLRLANAGQVGVGAASGVAIELGDSAGTKIPLGQESGQYVLGLGDNSLKFQAAYIATKTAVTVGPANATAQFTVAYK